MDKIKAFILSKVTALVVWLVLVSVAAVLFTWGIVAHNWAIIGLAVADTFSLALTFAAKLLV